MSADDYAEMAEHYRRAKEATKDDFTRRFLEQMERSFRVLAASEAVLEGSRRTRDELERSPSKGPSDE
ncbi:hypothetical protein AB7M49_007830 [Bradyrhizobium elkanii]|jgi:hypothetical protein|nr:MULTISPECIES: hypothetical protein [Bradyrhizobium]MCS3448519.1 hypothetical protein [Bradyrhizobium elkanii]MCS3560339.1 hypothetical protein [Bradyrhizobium elkanii]MCW2149816.1 hypothetical protein [Bradyrhizobium elkanii]MCW2360215.1 hypothetical protein [Bradyrhizobium elkanii]MCW2373545.1 hypothetical protein [Bradyrhizobium elkanii]